jgi:hypothetical protein
LQEAIAEKEKKRKYFKSNFIKRLKVIKEAEYHIAVFPAGIPIHHCRGVSNMNQQPQKITL